MPTPIKLKSSYLLATLTFVLVWTHLNFSQPADAHSIDRPTQPPQPASGPGGAEYRYDSVLYFDQAKKPEGFWLFAPQGAATDTLPVVVFLHGYGGYNPMIYGAWIRHLVRKGQIVIFPRYQRNLWSPSPDKFPDNTAQGILDALAFLRKHALPQPDLAHLSYIGHSYGGVIAANLSIRAAEYDLPTPEAVFLCAPGSGPFDGARLDSYADFPSETKLLILTGENDQVVGEEFAWKVFNEAVHTPWRNLLRQYKDPYGQPPVGAGHNQSYAPDLAFDSGMRNPTARRALRHGRVNAVDYYGYWKLADALLACARTGTWCETAFGGTEAQRSLGTWSDGTPIRPLDVFLPEQDSQALQAER